MTQDEPLQTEEPKTEEPFNPDVAKFTADFHKHITTLATGTLVLLFSVIDKMFPAPKWKFLVALTMLALLGTVFACVASYSLHLLSVENSRKLTVRQKRLDDLLGLCILGSFVGALAFLVCFFLRNYLFP